MKRAHKLGQEIKAPLSHWATHHDADMVAVIITDGYASVISTLGKETLGVLRRCCDALAAEPDGTAGVGELRQKVQ